MIPQTIIFSGIVEMTGGVCDAAGNDRLTAKAGAWRHPVNSEGRASAIDGVTFLRTFRRLVNPSSGGAELLPERMPAGHTSVARDRKGQLLLRRKY